MPSWPRTPEELLVVQLELAAAEPPPWHRGGRVAAGACFVCFAQAAPGPGSAGDPGWASAALRDLTSLVTAPAAAEYRAGMLALREGPMLERAVRALPEPPDVLIVSATGRDHPRQAGLALHLGAVLDLPTVGVTHRPLLARGTWPGEQRGARSPLRLEADLVGYWVRTRPDARPLAVHAGWRVDPETAVELVLEVTGRNRTPDPLRRARQAARLARAGDTKRPGWS